MCIGGSPSYATPQRETAAFQDAPPVVTGKQTGVENPKDTKKVTEELKIKRQKKEGTYVNPNLQRTTQLLTKSSRSSGGRGGVVARNERSARLRGKTGSTKAQTMAKNRNKTSTKTNTSTSRSRHSSQSRTRRGGRR